MKFGDPSRWLIHKRGDEWRVYPPVGSFWGLHTYHETGGEALASFREQTSHIKG
jgi:hypothetical protein